MSKIYNLLLILGCAIAVQAQGISDDLYAFDFRMEAIPIPERVQLLTDLGYQGATFAVRDEASLKKLSQYRDTEAFRKGKFSVPIVYIPFQFGKDDATKPPIWERILATSPGTSIWLIIKNDNGEATPEKTKALLRRMSEATQKAGVDLVLYPHDNTFIESVEEGLPYLEKAGCTDRPGFAH